LIFRVCEIGTVAEGAPIIPISAQLKYNIEVVCEYIVKKIPVPLRDFTSEPRLIGKDLTHCLLTIDWIFSHGCFALPSFMLTL